MFEYAISAGEGTLLDYGMATSFEMEAISNGGKLVFFDNGDMARVGFLGATVLSNYSMRFHPVQDDCETGK